MKYQIFEQVPIKLKGFMKTGRPKDDKVTFVIAKDGAEIAREDGTLEARAGASCSYTPPEVDPDKTHYVLTYWILSDGVETKNGDQLFVWPKKGKIKVIHDEKIDGKDGPLKGFQYYVGQQKKWKPGPPTEADGTAEFDLFVGEPFKISDAAPFRITERVKEAGHEWELKGTQEFVVEFKKPSIEPAPDAPPEAKPKKQEFEQYVNLQTANKKEPGLDGNGRIVLLEIGVRQDPTLPAGENPAKEGTPVYIKATFDGVGGPSKRTKPKPRIIKPDELAALSDDDVDKGGLQLDVSDVKLEGADTPGQPRTYTAIVKLTADGKPGKCLIDLGYAGGDTCEIEIGSTKECKDAGLKFTNWRKLHYEMLYPDFMERDLEVEPDPETGGDRVNLPQELRKKFEDRFKPAFIKYELYKSKSFAKNPNLKGVVSADFIKGGFLGAAGPRDCYMYAPAWKDEIPENNFTSTAKTCIQIRMWDRCFMGATEDKDFHPVMDVESKSWDLGETYYLEYNPATGSDAITNAEWEPVFPDPNPYIKPTALEWETPTQPSTAGAVAAEFKIEEILADPHPSVEVDFGNCTPSLEWETPAQPDTTGAQSAAVRVEEILHGKPAIDLAFKEPRVGHTSTTLDPSEVTKITSLLKSLLSDQVALSAEPRLRFKIIADWGNSRRTTRFNNVKAAVDSAFTASSPGTFLSQVLSDGEKAKVDTFLAGILENNVPGLRAQGNKIKLKINGSWGAAGCTERFAFIKNELQAAYNAHCQEIPCHPALDDDGLLIWGSLPRSAMQMETYTKIKITLPKRQDPADPLGPGDLVGSLSDTKVPIKVLWDQVRCTGAINGNSGGGKQQMVLKPKDLDGCSQTLCHELGHSMGMTVTENMTAPMWLKKAPPGLKDLAKHVDSAGAYYVTSGNQSETHGRRAKHKGAHCAQGLAANWTNSASTWGNVGTCIMWGAGAATRDKFCPLCITLLRGRNIKDIHSGYDARPSEDDY